VDGHSFLQKVRIAATAAGQTGCLFIHFAQSRSLSGYDEYLARKPARSVPHHRRREFYYINSVASEARHYRFEESLAARKAWCAITSSRQTFVSHSAWTAIF